MSLSEGGEYSCNKLRLQALESIEMIMRELREKKDSKLASRIKAFKSPPKARSSDSVEVVSDSAKKMSFNQSKIAKKNMIYKYLSHHYI